MPEKVFTRRPDHAQALDCAAHCYFLAGDHNNGCEFVKRAFQLGVSETYRD